MSSYQNENCLVCGHPLDYSTIGDKFECILCGKKEIGNVHCSKGHYVCDTCHSKETYDELIKAILSGIGNNPLRLAQQIIQEVEIPMLGCEHSLIVTGVLLKSIQNTNSLLVTDAMIMEAINRTNRQAIGAYCGLTGVCGIAIGVGSVFSVY